MGPDAAHKPIILEGENITISKSVATHTEMGFLEGRTFIIQEILAVLDVPPAKLGRMGDANRSNSKEQDQSFRAESVAPLQWIMEAAINGQFVRPIMGVTDTIFVHAEGNNRDEIERMEYFTKAEGWGILSPNEVRAKLGYAPVDGGDVNFVMTPTGAVPLDRMDLYFQIPKTNVQDVPPSKENDDPVEGEPMPQRTQNTNTQTVGKAHTQNIAEAMALLKSATHKGHLAVAYSYLTDALDLGLAEIKEAYTAVQKALSADDPLLAEGYLGRAIRALQPFDHLGDE